jgi:hypothetical protein
MYRVMALVVVISSLPLLLAAAASPTSEQNLSKENKWVESMKQVWAKSKTGKRHNIRDDPADSWLAYAISQGNGQLLTFLNATWKVPQTPTDPYGGNAPGWWFGIEPYPASLLIQPILAWGYTSEAFTIFNGYFDWNTMNFWSSDQGVVQPGDTIYAYVEYVSSNNSYNMFISCLETGWSILNNIPVDYNALYTDAYFVLEHQPNDCQGYPPNGIVTFYDINLALNYRSVTPKWKPYTYIPACNSQVSVLSPSSLRFTWNAN